ncbi:MAG: hypothetical protein MR925_00300 [Veillonellaceae bacterium]|nr:hypothetical protein [Veillonellaceae bacterium]MCI7266015.1 hypothetical protein [Veillonellaceae bacterium]MDY4486321.1 hypothetical protein [Anaerovibrio sp.]
MEFFVIAASIMSICIISIYKIARKLGADISLSALVLCGVSALIINFMSIRVNPFLTKTYYYMLGAMIIFAATGTTCYNKYLLYRRSRLAVHGAPSEDNEITQVTSEPETIVEVTEEPETTAEAEVTEEPETTAEVQQVVEAPLPTLPEGLDSMDALLDFAFAQIGAGAYELALLAYSTALEQYRNDDYAPFIIIDMVNLYKSQGRYQEAIDCVHNAMDIPAIQESPAYQQKFQNYLAQLRSISHSAVSTQSPED